ncbi:MAG: hypothetical protein IPN03_00440 [Holophagales bacterium]|nr:hypothetical protein [Holophagales bacterium]
MRDDANPEDDRLPLFVVEDPRVRYARVERPGDEPPAVRSLLDVAVLDMHHGFANLGHASVVDRLMRIGQEERRRLGAGAPGVRVVSYDVRLGGAVPTSASRFALVVGTGGPGALDPRENDGVSPYAQGILEDPSWEAPLWRFFDAVRGNPSTALLGICHTFGLLARWAGFGEAAPRSARKGKSAGVVTNLLTDEARRHAWFKGLYHASAGGRIQVLDSRLFDILPTGKTGIEVLAHEASPEGERGEAITMAEVERFADGRPRIWAVNHHPEIGDAGEQRARLLRIAASRQLSESWLGERIQALEAWNASEAAERRLQITTSYTFEEPVRAILSRGLVARRDAGPA